MTPHRPVFLDLTKIQMPVGALTSIGHRISDVVLVLGRPVTAWLFALSLHDEGGFAYVMALLGRLPFKVVVVVVWALTHHLLGGVLHLLADFNIGSTRDCPQVSQTDGDPGWRRGRFKFVPRYRNRHPAG